MSRISPGSIFSCMARICVDENDMLKVQAENEEGVKLIAKEDAVCEICYYSLERETSVQKTKCNCGSSLKHTGCAHENPKCASCGEVIQYISATLSKPEGKKPKPPTSHRRWRWVPKFFRRQKSKTNG